MHVLLDDLGSHNNQSWGKSGKSQIQQLFWSKKYLLKRITIWYIVQID